MNSILIIHMYRLIIIIIFFFWKLSLNQLSQQNDEFNIYKELKL